MQMAPQSALPGTPSGRRATIAEWIQQGLVTADEGRELSGIPDIKSNYDERFATRDSVLSAIELMADDGKFVMPHPLLNLGEAKKLVASAYTRLEWEGCPEDNLELVARYASALLMLEQQGAANTNTAAVGAAMPGPGGAPSPTPTPAGGIEPAALAPGGSAPPVPLGGAPMFAPGEMPVAPAA
jgi:hypothetical protein